VLVTLETKEDCLKKLFKLPEPHARSLSLSINEFQTAGPSIENARRPCVESTVRYDELVSVCRTPKKPRSDVGGWGDKIGEVPRCPAMQTAVHHDAQLVCDPVCDV